MARPILLAGLAALSPVLATQGAARANPVSTESRFNPPLAPLVLTRTVWRDLKGGLQIVVTRRYEVRFVAEPGGYRMDGSLIGVTVDAPDDLAPFADLERNRPDTAMFPVQIDAQGRILPQQIPVDMAAHQHVLQLTNAALAKAPLGEAERRHSIQQAAQLMAGNGAIGTIPADLFRPQPGERHERRSIALADGQEGQIEITTSVVAPDPGGPARKVDRAITTSLAGTTRVSREEWTIEPR